MLAVGVFSLLALGCGTAQVSSPDGEFALTLPSHPGQLRWHADGFSLVESSAKPNGNEMGARGKDAAGRFTFLTFLFVLSDLGPLNSERCRDGMIAMEKKSNSRLTVSGTFEMTQSDGQKIALIVYSSPGRDKKNVYMLRGFIADADLCGDMEFYSDAPIAENDPDLKKVFATYRLDTKHIAEFKETFSYAQILFDHHMYPAAAPVFELALTRLGDDDLDPKTWRRVATDQAGMAYGISGNIAKARALFNEAIAKDPDYPMYYYNLACADAEEKKLDEAQLHLKQAFDRKANVIRGENLPDPTKDDSFLLYRGNKQFWEFLEQLH